MQRNFSLVLVLGYLSILLSADALAQEPSRPTESMYIEAFGNTGSYSMNFDVAFPSGIGFRFGALSSAETKVDDNREFYNEQTGFAFLMMLNMLHGKGDHHLETGIGFVAGASRFPGLSPAFASPAGTATLGYRYQGSGEGLIVRIGFTPAFTMQAIRPMVGASIGYSLGALF